jgi:hypothetical protein
MKRLLQYWSVTFYTIPIFWIILVISLIIALKNRNKFTVLKFLPFYILSLIVDITVTSIYSAFPHEWKTQIFRVDRYIDHLFTLFEFIVFSIFFLQTINNRFKRIFIKSLFILFQLIFILLSLNQKQFLSFSEQTIASTYSVEAVFLILFSIFYYHELFSTPLEKTLVNEPTFWVVTGLFFFMASTLPYSILQTLYIDNFFLRQLFSLFYISYTLMFILIIRGFLCKPIKTN